MPATLPNVHAPRIRMSALTLTSVPRSTTATPVPAPYPYPESRIYPPHNPSPPSHFDGLLLPALTRLFSLRSYFIYLFSPSVCQFLVPYPGLKNELPSRTVAADRTTSYL
ncbi:hypothetical protein C8F04DRAFT_188311, partial [Mycena alexandri]